MNTNIRVIGTQTPVELKNIPAFRQAFIAAASIILVGVVLSRTIHPDFILLPVLVAGGLLFSGLVGWCPMALILERMPWNKR